MAGEESSHSASPARASRRRKRAFFHRGLWYGLAALMFLAVATRVRLYQAAHKALPKELPLFHLHLREQFYQFQKTALEYKTNTTNNNTTRNSSNQNSTDNTSTTSPSSKLPKIVFAGVARNVNRGGRLHFYVPKVLRLLQQISFEYHVVVLENDSTDGTRQVFQHYLQNQSYATLLQPPDHGGGGGRTDRLAHVRNLVLQHIVQHFPHYDYVFINDMDGVCGGSNMTVSFDANIFKYVLFQLRDQWDVLSFRFVPYWDLWALRHAEFMPHNIFGPSRRHNRIRNDKDAADVLFGNVSWPDGLTAVDSAFMMMSIYKMSLFANNKTDNYNGTVVRYRGREQNSSVADCEHVALHHDLRVKMGARIRVSPLVYCLGDPGYRPLPQDIVAQLPLS